MFNVRCPIGSLRKNASLAAVAEAALAYAHNLKRAHLNLEDRRKANNHEHWNDPTWKTESEQLMLASMEWLEAARHLYRTSGMDFEKADAQEWERTRAIRAANELRGANGKLTLDLTKLSENA